MHDVKDILSSLHSASPEDVSLVTRAYLAVTRAHEGQKRFSGEPYIHHVHETALILARLKADAATVAAGLLHDTLEDNLLSEETLRKEFSEEVLFLVQGVTKLGTLKYKGLKRHAESLRKLFIATAQDIRVLIIRLADRLHNVKTLHGHASEEKRRRIAQETLEIFVPLANRLGMGELRGELEDAAFPYAYPKEYKEVKEIVHQKKNLDEKYLEKVRRSLGKELAVQGIRVLGMDYRMKRLYGLYKKLAHKDMDIEKIYDVIALRVIVPTVEDCYRVLGVIHGMWRPLPGRIKDYIALPKLNGYKSLHTTIFTGDGGIAEIQIRTKEMHEEAQYGVASHLSYKEIGKNAEKARQHLEKKFPWIKALLEWQKHFSESGDFLHNLKMDFFRDRVFVFTPRGDVIDLPEGSTAVDFAYTIHTDIGSHMAGAKINGKLASLETALKNGDIVEILTKKDAHPTDKWLKAAKTSLAAKQIRAATHKEGFTLKNFLPNIGRRLP